MDSIRLDNNLTKKNKTKTKLRRSKFNYYCLVTISLHKLTFKKIRLRFDNRNRTTKTITIIKYIERKGVVLALCWYAKSNRIITY